MRTFRVQLVALTLLRLLQARLNQAWEPGRRWRKPEWNPHKRHASILNLRRLFWRYRREFAHFLVAPEEREKIPQPRTQRRDLTGRAA